MLGGREFREGGVRRIEKNEVNVRVQEEWVMSMNNVWVTGLCEVERLSWDRCKTVRWISMTEHWLYGSSGRRKKGDPTLSWMQWSRRQRLKRTGSLMRNIISDSMSFGRCWKTRMELPTWRNLQGRMSFTEGGNREMKKVWTNSKKKKINGRKVFLECFKRVWRRDVSRFFWPRPREECWR